MENFLTVNEFCTNQNINASFLSSLQLTCLIEIITDMETEYINENQMVQFNKFIHSYFELNINYEGIENITQLLKRVKLMQEENIMLKNKLHFYESGY